MNTNHSLWRATCRNLCLATLIFGCLIGLLWLIEYLIPDFQGRFIKFHDAAWIVGIPASIIGVGYILSIKDPNNYTGFYAGIVMSALLGFQFFLQGQYDSTILYFCFFIPFQITSIINWKKSAQEKNSETDFEPSFLSMKGMVITVLALVLITFADYCLQTYIIKHDALTDNMAVKLLNGLLISSSIFANFWLIYRKNDAWLYWILYSLSGIGLFVLISNIFSIVLFAFFLIINTLAGVAWVKSTPKQNFGWLIGK